MLDNLLAGTESDIVEMYDTLRSKRIVFLFLTTSNAMFFSRPSAKYNVEIFLTCGLIPDDAVAYTQHRMKQYRDGVPPLVDAYQLVPFEVSDLRDAVVAKLAPELGVVTLRVLGTTLNILLESRMDELDNSDPTFDLASLASADIRKFIISIPKEYSVQIGR